MKCLKKTENVSSRLSWHRQKLCLCQLQPLITKKTQLLKYNLCSYGRNDYHIRSNINWSKVSQLFSFPGQYVLFVLGTFVSIYRNIIKNWNERITFKMSDLKWLIFWYMCTHNIITCACCFLHAGLDREIQACQNFYKDGLTLSFTKILTDDAVNGWKYDIQVSLSSAPSTSS